MEISIDVIFLNGNADTGASLLNQNYRDNPDSSVYKTKPYQCIGSKNTITGEPNYESDIGAGVKCEDNLLTFYGWGNLDSSIFCGHLLIGSGESLCAEGTITIMDSKTFEWRDSIIQYETDSICGSPQANENSNLLIDSYCVIDGACTECTCPSGFFMDRTCTGSETTNDDYEKWVVDIDETIQNGLLNGLMRTSADSKSAMPILELDMEWEDLLSNPVNTRTYFLNRKSNSNTGKKCIECHCAIGQYITAIGLTSYSCNGFGFYNLINTIDSDGDRRDDEDRWSNDIYTNTPPTRYDGNIYYPSDEQNKIYEWNNDEQPLHNVISKYSENYGCAACFCPPNHHIQPFHDCLGTWKAGTRYLNALTGNWVTLDYPDGVSALPQTIDPNSYPPETLVFPEYVGQPKNLWKKQNWMTMGIRCSKCECPLDTYIVNNCAGDEHPPVLIYDYTNATGNGKRLCNLNEMDPDKDDISDCVWTVANGRDPYNPGNGTNHRGTDERNWGWLPYKNLHTADDRYPTTNSKYEFVLYDGNDATDTAHNDSIVNHVDDLVIYIGEQKSHVADNDPRIMYGNFFTHIVSWPSVANNNVPASKHGIKEDTTEITPSRSIPNIQKDDTTDDPREYTAPYCAHCYCNAGQMSSKD